MTVRNVLKTGAILIIAHLCAIPALAIEWTSTVDGDWHLNTNWSPTTVPDAQDAVATLGFTGLPTTATKRTITMDSNATVGSISMGGAAQSNYTVSGSGVLTFDVSSGSALLTSSQTSNPSTVIIRQTIAVDVKLDDPFRISSSNSNWIPLISGDISGTVAYPDVDITLAGEGAMFSGNNNFGNGSITLTESATLRLLSATAGGGAAIPILLNSDDTGIFLNVDSATDFGHDVTVAASNTLLFVESTTSGVGGGNKQTMHDIDVQAGQLLTIDTSHARYQYLRVDGEMMIRSGATLNLDVASGAASRNPRLYIGSGAFLRGIGSITMSTAGNMLVIESGGTVAPGASIGTLTTQRINFDAGSNLAIELGGDTGDLLQVSETLTVSGTGTTLWLSGDYAATPIIIAGTMLGAFDTVNYNGSPYPWVGAQEKNALGGRYFMKITDSGIFIIPEPASALLLGLSLLGFRRRRLR